MEHEYQTFQRHCALNLLANSNDDSTAEDASRPGDTINAAAGQVDAMPNTVLYAVLVSRDRQYLDTANIPAAVPDWTSSTRIVYGFIEGKFDSTEMRNFFEAFVNAASVALNAEAFFRHFDDGLTILTGGLTFDGGNVPPCILEFTSEFSHAKLLDELTYRRIKQVWNDTLCSIQTTPARSSVPT